MYQAIKEKIKKSDKILFVVFVFLFKHVKFYSKNSVNSQ